MLLQREQAANSGEEKRVKRPAALVETQNCRNSNHKDSFQEAAVTSYSIVVNRIILNLKILYCSSSYTITSKPGSFSCTSQGNKGKTKSLHHHIHRRHQGLQVQELRDRLFSKSRERLHDDSLERAVIESAYESK